jgi:hypothetical protein
MVSKLEEELSTQNDVVYNSEDESEVEEAEERVSEIESEIEDIKLSPEGEPTVGMVESVLDDRLDEVKNDILSYMNDYGMDLKDYVDMESLISDVIDMDGTGPSLGGYDGEENEADVNNITYFVYRVE